MSHRPAEGKPPAKFTWREARPNDPMFGKIFIVPIRTLIAEEEPGILGETEDLSRMAMSVRPGRSNGLSWPTRRSACVACARVRAIENGGRSRAGFGSPPTPGPFAACP